MIVLERRGLQREDNSLREKENFHSGLEVEGAANLRVKRKEIKARKVILK